MTSKEAYILFSEQTPELPLFLQPWWLDAVTQPDGKKWEVLLARNKNGEIEAVMPFVLGSKFGMRYALTPQLTQYTGVWIVDKEGESITDRLSREKKLQNDLIQQLDALHLSFFDVRFPLTYTYWSPFYWAGYKQETHYTYRIEDLSDLTNVYSNIDKVKRRHIHHAEQELSIHFDMSALDFYHFQCQQLSTNNDQNVLSKELVVHLIDTCRSRNQGFIVSAKDNIGTVHAAYFIPYDQHAAYELISAIHPEHRTSGGSVLALWNAIKKAAEVTKIFDFEGSMIENVEHNNRQFGGSPYPYFQIQKTNKFLGIIEACKK